MKNKIVIAFTFSLLCFSSAYAKNNPVPENIHYDTIVEQAYQKFKTEKTGTVADYIPALAKYSPDNYAIVIATIDGKIYSAGDKDALFPLESLSKIFTLALVLNQQGPQTVLTKLGANATGLPFNSGLAIELRPDRPQNPLVNAGAISAVSLIKAENPDDRWQQIMQNMEAYADNSLIINEEVYRSESETNQHNQALARLMLSYGMLYGDPEVAVDLYTRQCSVDATTVDLAKMGAVFANHGKSPYSGKQLLSAENTGKVLAEMAIAGLHDGSGEWLYQVGIPAKSGVGGGILAVVPGKYAVAVYSPPLDKAGNSVRAQAAIGFIAQETGADLYQ